MSSFHDFLLRLPCTRIHALSCPNTSLLRSLLHLQASSVSTWHICVITAFAPLYWPTEPTVLCSNKWYCHTPGSIATSFTLQIDAEQERNVLTSYTVYPGVTSTTRDLRPIMGSMRHARYRADAVAYTINSLVPTLAQSILCAGQASERIRRLIFAKEAVSNGWAHECFSASGTFFVLRVPGTVLDD